MCSHRTGRGNLCPFLLNRSINQIRNYHAIAEAPRKNCILPEISDSPGGNWDGEGRGMDGDITRDIWLFHQVAPVFPVAAVKQLLEYWCNFPVPGYGILLAFISQNTIPPARGACMKVPRAHCPACLGWGRLLVISVRKRFAAADVWIRIVRADRGRRGKVSCSF